MDRSRSFSAVVTADRKGRVLVPVPFDPDDTWGHKPQHHVAGTVNGLRVRAVIERDGDARGIVLGPAWRRDCGIAPGDEVAVVLAPEGPQRDDLAPDVAAALEAEPQAAAFFDSLAQFYRKGYLRWIDATKRRPDVRAARIAEVVRLCKDHIKERPRRDLDPGQSTIGRTVDDYLRALPADVRKALEDLRRAIREAAPDAVETISYRVPTFSQGEPIVGFGAAKHHCSFYVMSPPLVASLADELDAYDLSGGTIRFQVGAPLPPSLVARVVSARIEENAVRKRS
ncbi:MAG: YdeI/OmpD-associated family protein [Acidimicrobiia bacterium]